MPHGLGPGIVFRPKSTSKGSVEYEARRTFGAGRGKKRAQVATFRNSEQDGTLRSGGIYDGTDIIHSLLKRQVADISVRKPGAPLVEPDDTGEAAETVQKSGVDRMLLANIQIRYPAKNVDMIVRSGTIDLIFTK